MIDKAVADAVSSFGKAASARLSRATDLGDRRKPSPLGGIQPDHGLAEYTTELLNVLGLLVDLEPPAAQLLERICSGPLLSQADLKAAGAFFPEGFVSATAPGPVQLGPAGPTAA